MYAVVEVGGMQWKVTKSVTIRVPKMEEEPGKSIELDRVLLVVDKETVRIGKSIVPDVKVKATVLSHGRAKKVNVFKKKRRKNYRVLRGHRQAYTELRIDQISLTKADKKKKAAAVKVEAKEPPTSKEVSPKQKKTPSRPTKKKPTSSPKTGAKAASGTAKTKKLSVSPKSKAKKASSTKK